MSNAIQGNYSTYYAADAKGAQNSPGYKGDAEDNSIFDGKQTSSNRFIDDVNKTLQSDSSKETSGSGSLVDEAKDLMSKAEKEAKEAKKEEGGGLLSWKIWPWNWSKS